MTDQQAARYLATKHTIPQLRKRQRLLFAQIRIVHQNRSLYNRDDALANLHKMERVHALAVDMRAFPKEYTPDPWQAATNGTGKRQWFCVRGDGNTPLFDRYLRDSRGQVRRFGSQVAAEKAAQ